MKPQSNPSAGFYTIDNLRIMPENSNCSNLMDDEAVEGWQSKARVWFVSGHAFRHAESAEKLV
jgi:hypothetical protein